MEDTMKPLLPKTDSIEELARFWGCHDVTDWDDELTEAKAAVFSRRPGVAVPVRPSSSERHELRRIAASRGPAEGALIHQWVKERHQHP
jgi:hypothetical protein